LGLAQIVFYSGARVVIQGPAEVQLISQNHACVRRGRIKADVPAQARGFRVETPEVTVTDLGTSFGLDVKERQTELHVFEGSVNVQPAGKAKEQNTNEGAGVIIEDASAVRTIKANPDAFAFYVRWL
jgi:ferric-dicitrate binding protein FerR (iron transport regulator)